MVNCMNLLLDTNLQLVLKHDINVHEICLIIKSNLYWLVPSLDS